MISSEHRRRIQDMAADLGLKDVLYALVLDEMYPDVLDILGSSIVSSERIRDNGWHEDAQETYKHGIGIVTAMLRSMHKNVSRRIKTEWPVISGQDEREEEGDY